MQFILIQFAKQTVVDVVVVLVDDSRDDSERAGQHGFVSLGPPCGRCDRSDPAQQQAADTKKIRIQRFERNRLGFPLKPTFATTRCSLVMLP